MPTSIKLAQIQYASGVCLVFIFCAWLVDLAVPEWLLAQETESFTWGAMFTAFIAFLGAHYKHPLGTQVMLLIALGAGITTFFSSLRMFKNMGYDMAECKSLSDGQIEIAANCYNRYSSSSVNIQACTSAANPRTRSTTQCVEILTDNNKSLSNAFYAITWLYVIVVFLCNVIIVLLISIGMKRLYAASLAYTLGVFNIVYASYYNLNATVNKGQENRQAIIENLQRAKKYFDISENLEGWNSNWMTAWEDKKWE